MSLPKNHTYKPLPEGLAIKDSKIHGQGLFASTIGLPTLYWLGTTHVTMVGFENNLIRTPLGAFLNHSDTPNCKLIQYNEGYWGLLTIEEIYIGNELTVDYNDSPCMGKTTSCNQ